MAPKAVSLFTGIGGMDLGLERAGFEVARQVEIDRYCLRILNRHWPDVPKGKDVRKEEPETYAERYGAIDLVCGGFPCQDLSVAGKRAGLAGERSGLFFEFLRIVAAVRPAWVLAENVPGLLSSWSPVEPPPYEVPTRCFDTEEEAEEWADSLEGCWDVEETSDFETVISELEKLGYCVAWRVFDAQYDGVAQRRDRVFIVGSLGSLGGPRVLFEPDCLPGNPPPSREKGIRTGSMVSHCLKASGGYKGDPTHETYVVDVCGPLTAGKNCGWKVNAENAAGGQLVVAATLRSGGAGGVPSSRGENVVIGGFKHNAGTSAGSVGYAIEQAPTLQAGQASAVQTYDGVRRFTPTECERLQAFPDGWTLYPDGKTPDSPRYRALGNAVCVNVAEWIGKRIKAVMDKEASPC